MNEGRSNHRRTRRVCQSYELLCGMMIDFLVVDSRKNNYSRIIKEAKFGQRGAVLVCKNAMSDLRLRNLFDGLSTGRVQIIKSRRAGGSDGSIGKLVRSL